MNLIRLSILSPSQQVTIQVDDEIQRTGTTVGDFTMMSSKLMYIGGATTPTKLPTETENFRGCLKQVHSYIYIYIYIYIYFFFYKLENIYIKYSYYVRVVERSINKDDGKNENLMRNLLIYGQFWNTAEKTK